MAALATARHEHLIPRRWSPGSRDRYDGPWPHEWPCLEIARSDDARDFIASLREAYPARFPDGVKFPFKDPEQYAAAFLRAVIADSIVRQARLSPSSREVRSLLDELHRLVSKEGQTFASLWLVDDVDFSAVDEELVDQVSLRAPSQPQNVVSSLLPEALWANDASRTPSARNGGFLFSSQDGLDYHWETTRVLNETIGRLVTAIRLATGSTGPTRIVWMGEPSIIHVQMPEAHPQTEAFVMEPRWRRIGVVTAGDLPGLRALTSLIAQAQTQAAGQGKQATVSSVAIAIGRYSRSLTGMSWQDTVLDLATALEACLCPGTTVDIALALKTRAAHLLGRNDPNRADAIFRDVKQLYDLRSDLIHGNAHFKRTPAKLFEDRGYAHVLVEDRMHALLDGWRDIVRRAICARLLLADTRLDRALWPLTGNETSVDRALVRHDQRDELFERLVKGASELGLPSLVEPAPALVDDLQRRSPQQTEPVVLRPTTPPVSEKDQND